MCEKMVGLWAWGVVFDGSKPNWWPAVSNVPYKLILESMLFDIFIKNLDNGLYSSL